MFSEPCHRSLAETLPGRLNFTGPATDPLKSEFRKRRKTIDKFSDKNPIHILACTKSSISTISYRNDTTASISFCPANQQIHERSHCDLRFTTTNVLNSSPMNARRIRRQGTDFEEEGYERWEDWPRNEWDPGTYWSQPTAFTAYVMLLMDLELTMNWLPLNRQSVYFLCCGEMQGYPQHRNCTSWRLTLFTIHRDSGD